MLSFIWHTGSIWSRDTFLPPLLRSLNVPCKTNNAGKKKKNNAKENVAEEKYQQILHEEIMY